MSERYLDAWYQDVPALIQKTDAVYAAWIQSGKPYEKFSKAAVTKKKIYESRGWEVCKPFIEENFDPTLSALNIFYVPKALQPGPAFVFPVRDLDNVWRQAQFRPAEGSRLWGEGKYITLGTMHAFKGPRWIGNDWETIRKIIRVHTVVLVEGPFDLLACRLLVPEVPCLSTLTKRISDDQLDYLSILGVKTIYLMYDNEKNNEPNRIGMFTARKTIREKCCTEMHVDLLTCDASDPSQALRNRGMASSLKTTLRTALSS